MTKTLSIYPSCGTPAGYRRHVRDGTEKCPKCKKAIAEYMQRYRHEKGISKSRLIPDTVIQKHGIKVNA